VIGHHISVCKWLNPAKDNKKEERGKQGMHDNIKKVVKREYVGKNRGLDAGTSKNAETIQVYVPNQAIVVTNKEEGT
ncbi:hypothetical protein A2U01_0003911, partial [Trifolium medium]|nr:hypothetical protein [Trifolium medium]